MINEKKVAFISCVNDESMYKECVRYIENISIPSGYEVELIALTNQKSLTSAYNNAMKQTDAKYKVYLHQDTFILNKNFIFDILNIFEVDKKNGMIGVIGTKKMPTNGIYWEGIDNVGVVYENHTGEMKPLKYKSVGEKYDVVDAIDGLIMITQYDIPWRDDVFDGWHFYDISQSIEFKLSGYNVVVPRQEKVWCLHDCERMEISGELKYEYEKYRKIFLEEYSERIFPLVSILIPTYNRPREFRIALESAINQTYKNIEIIVGDDSTNEETKKIMSSYLRKYKNIKYFYNGGPLGEYGIKNHENIYRVARGEYINFLMDDDLFSENKIERMMDYYLNYKNISLVTSYRQRIDYLGNKTEDSIYTSKLWERDSRWEGDYIARKLINDGINFIGEPTTVLLKRESIDGDIGTYLGRRYKCMIDMAQWLECCMQGDVVYISEALSSFRVHSGQNQRKEGVILEALIDKYYIITDSYDKKVFGLSLEEIKQAMNKWYEEAVSFLENIKENELDTSRLEKILSEYNKKNGTDFR